MNTRTERPLFWRVSFINGVVFLVGTAALAVSPATVSSRVLMSEVVVLGVGLTIILIANGLLLRASLEPLDRLARTMNDVDLAHSDVRVPETGSGVGADLAMAFNRMLTRLNTERGQRAAEALAAQESERSRIAQELHDEIGQNLTVVLLGLKRVADQAPPALAEEILDLRETARVSLDDVRRVARRLRPGVLDDLGLLSALSALATDFSASSDLSVRRGLSPGLPPLDHDAELVIYRVAQEGLTNAARHSKAQSVDLTLSRIGPSVLLRIADDGQGMANATEGAGIRGMRERAALVGGNLELRSHPGGGTELQLVVPASPTGDRTNGTT